MVGEPGELFDLARLWVAGADIDWAARYTDHPAARVPLPTYPFQRGRYWIDPPVIGSQP